MIFPRLVYNTKAKFSLVDALEYILIFLVITTTGAIWFRYGPVSYTHLDVYKRQTNYSY